MGEHKELSQEADWRPRVVFRRDQAIELRGSGLFGGKQLVSSVSVLPPCDGCALLRRRVGSQGATRMSDHAHQNLTVSGVSDKGIASAIEAGGRIAKKHRNWIAEPDSESRRHFEHNSCRGGRPGENGVPGSPRRMPTGSPESAAWRYSRNTSLDWIRWVGIGGHAKSGR